MWGISNYLNPTLVGPPPVRQFSTHRATAPNLIKQPSNELPYSQNLLTEIAACKKFANPNYVNVSTKPEPGLLYEKCSKFVNISNGYPNNIRKDHLESINIGGDILVEQKLLGTMGASKAEKVINPPQKSNPIDITEDSLIKKSRRRVDKVKKVGRGVSRKKDHHRNHNKNDLNPAELEYLAVDEIGLDACSFFSSPSGESPCILESLNFPNEYVLRLQQNEWKPTLDEFMSKSSPRGVTNLIQFSNSPILVEIKTMSPVCFSISPPEIPGRSCRIERQPSLCASEDSFIQFEESESSSDEEYDTEEEDDVLESEDNNGIDETPTSLMFDDVDACKCPNQKKVRFAKGKDLVEVHPMHAWSFAYRASRKCYWENFARDRERFKRRIECCGTNIEKILDFDHRLKIFVDRFACDKDKNTEI